MEHGALGLMTGATTASTTSASSPSTQYAQQQHTTVGPILTAAPIAAEVAATTSAQLLPGHLKCGIWASLALATIFVAGWFGR